MIALVAYAFIAQVPSELVVRVDSVEAGADVCDLEARIPSTMAETLRGVQILRETSSVRIDPQKDRMRLIAFVRAIGVHFELFDDAGNSVLARDVPNPPDACPGTADGIAVIVERYLRDLGYEPGPVALPPIEPPVVRTSTRASTTATTTIPRRPPPSPEPERPRSFDLAVGVAPAAAIGLNPDHATWMPVLGLRIRIRYLELALDAGGFFRQVEQVTNPTTGDPAADLRVYSLFALGGAGVCIPLASAHVCATPKAGVEWMRGQANPLAPTMFSGSNNIFPIGLAGGEVRVDFPLVWRISVSPTVGMLFRLSQPVFIAKVSEPPAYKGSSEILTFGLAVWVRL
jgi:hypothetical protein